jgi:dihydrolipoamide dehydrogenase
MKLVIIGGGPAGRTAAMEAAGLGEDVILIEKDKIGGKCLHEGCMVVCGLNEIAKFYSDAINYNTLGITNQTPELNFEKVTSGLRMTTQKIKKVLEFETRETGARIVEGKAKIKDGIIELEEQEIEYDKLIIATGSRANIPNIPGVENAKTYKDIPFMDILPKKILIVGSGVIAAEYSNIFSTLGSEVTVFCRTEFLKMLDPEIKDYVTKVLLPNVKIIENVDVDHIHHNGLDSSGDFYEGDVILATGLIPNSEIGDGLVEIGPRKQIIVNQQMKTSHPNIYAAGDVTGGMTNTPVSRMEGVIAARNACGISSTMNYAPIPSSISLYYDISFLNYQDLDKGTVGTIPGAAGPGSFWRVLEGKTGLTKVAVDLENGNINGISSISPSSRTSMAYMAKMINDKYKTQNFDEFMEVHPSTDAIYKMLRFFSKYL